MIIRKHNILDSSLNKVAAYNFVTYWLLHFRQTNIFYDFESLGKCNIFGSLNLDDCLSELIDFKMKKCQYL